MEFVLRHVRERNATEVPKADGEDEYKGMLLEGMGINSHQARKYHDELQIPQKKKFTSSAHDQSFGFRELCVPCNRATLE